MVAKPKSLHRPEFAKFVGVQVAIDGRARYQFYVPSKSDDTHRYVYLVNDDGTAPYCSCLEPMSAAAQFGNGCHLCQPAVALEMAERGRAAAAGATIPVGF